MSCLRNQQIAARAARASGIAPLANRNAYLTAFEQPESLTTREVAKHIVYQSLVYRHRAAMLLGLNPHPDRSEMAVLLLGSAIMAPLVKRRIERRRGRLDG